jgi:hypothetical protein
MTAFMLTGEEKYRRWVLEYVGAWRQRMAENGGIIPSNVGLDGKIGGGAGGKWYGGTYGWGFTTINPVNGRPVHRNMHSIGLVGFTNAYLLTGDARYLDPWAKQMDLINGKSKEEGGRKLYPHMHGDGGWYHFTPEPYRVGATEIYHLTAREGDRKRAPTSGWLAWLEGKDAGYPERALRADLERIRGRVAAMRADTSTPDTRLSDNPLGVTPASTDALVQLTMGALPPARRGSLLHARVRYFDPLRHRPGLPDDVAALVETMTDTKTTLSVVNLDPLSARRVVIQGGAYAEHRIESVACEEKVTSVGAASVVVELGPGCGARLTLTKKRHANAPTFAFPPEA